MTDEPTTGRTGREPDRDRQSSRTLTLTTGGITLLGVLLSIGVTVGFGVSGALWVRILSGALATAALVGVVKVATAHGRGPLSRAANWIIGADGWRS